ncbi:hypothetical protein AALP_AA3G104600 [Arabis alpina]|uniref:Uncharacterized protein n=1 Tax=Arabis alpina TaxID=50452 RepID=A0A087H8B3_ARAAL|nr:hypothetical protein AALP_AA3G104600 [Arabis alpina]
MEPLHITKPVDFSKLVAYFPTEYLNDNILSSSSSSSWFLPSYPIDNKAFNIYTVDHNTSVMEVKKHGVTFVYHSKHGECENVFHGGIQPIT